MAYPHSATIPTLLIRVERVALVVVATFNMWEEMTVKEWIALLASPFQAMRPASGYRRYNRNVEMY